MKRVLFICSQNRFLSPTAEQVFSSNPALEVASAGLNTGAQNPVTPALLDLAELVFVMEKAHRNKLSKKFRSSLNRKRIICLDILDEYEYMDPFLVKVLYAKVSPFLPRK